MVNSISSAMASISSSYSESMKSMSASLARIGSGKRFQNASEDLGGYLKVKSIQSSVAQLQLSKDSISEAKGFIDTATAYASSMIDELNSLKAASIERGSATGTEETAAALAKFDGILASATENFLTEYNGNRLNAIAGDVTHETVRMANGGSLALTLTAATDSVTVADIAWDTNATTTNTAIDGELDTLYSMVGKLSGFSAQIEAQESFINTMQSNYEAAESTITAVNEAEEMAKYVENDIRQQSAIAMMAQANMSRFSILRLYQ